MTNWLPAQKRGLRAINPSNWASARLSCPVSARNLTIPAAAVPDRNQQKAQRTTTNTKRQPNCEINAAARRAERGADRESAELIITWWRRHGDED